MLPIKIIFYRLKKSQSKDLRKIVLVAYMSLPQNVKNNLIKHALAKHPAIVVFYKYAIHYDNVRRILKRTPAKIIKATNFIKDGGIFFHADNAIFINLDNINNVLFTLNHEFGHLVDHHNLNRHKEKWRERIKNIPNKQKITQYSCKSASEFFAEAYAIYTTNLEIFKFIAAEVFKSN